MTRALRRSRHQLRRIEQIDPLERLRRVVGEDLHAELPLRKRTRLDRVCKVATVKVGILPGKLLSLVPYQRLHALDRLPLELDELAQLGARANALDLDLGLIGARELALGQGLGWHGHKVLPK